MSDVCNNCNKSLEYGSTDYYKDGVIVETLCLTCSKRRAYMQYAEDKIINSRLMMTSSLISFDLENGQPLRKGDFRNAKHALQIDEDTKKLQVLAKSFEKEVWFNGLQKLLSKSTKKGFSAKSENISVLTYCMCGRCMIDIDVKGGHFITLITDEDSSESRMGIQGIYATFDQASDLITSAIQLYKNSMLDFKEDTNVRIAGF